MIKKAACYSNFYCKKLDNEIYEAIDFACDKIIEGKHENQFPLDAINGGAGTSLNMNLNEVIANTALIHIGKKPGEYSYIHPVNHVNMSQSTNDTFSTAIKIALIFYIRELHSGLERLQDAFQEKESEFFDVIKMGRTQLMDAVPITLGMEFSSYAEAVSRDRWRLYKTEERLRYINLGGTAVGTGLNASKRYQFAVVENLREITGIGLAKPENTVDITQNNDVFSEVSGLLKSCAVSLSKIASDLRLLSSGPFCGFNEITLPEKQLGSSIMPFKINPVIPEAVNQAAFEVFGNDITITFACQAGELELNAFLPIVADKLISSVKLLKNAVIMFKDHCIKGIRANKDVCKNYVEKSLGSAAVLVPVIGYDNASKLVKYCYSEGKTLKEGLSELKMLSRKETDEIFSNIHNLLKPE
jgi:aspartate ammonia-lyase